MPVRAMTAADAPQVLAIHQAGIDTGDATFAHTAGSWHDFDTTHRPNHRFVTHTDDGTVTGWIATSGYSPRHCYRGVVEHSLYVHPDHTRAGLGGLLLTTLLAACRRDGIWTVLAGVFPENTASLALHRRYGFRIVGRNIHFGQDAAGNFRDVIRLERRTTGLVPPAVPRGAAVRVPTRTRWPSPFPARRAAVARCPRPPGHRRDRRP